MFKLCSTTHRISPLHGVSVNINNIVICLHYIVAARITQKPSSVIVEEGKNVTLVCKATGQPTPTIIWRKAFGHLSKANIVVAGWNMTILSVTKADSGTYACSVENLLSEDSGADPGEVKWVNFHPPLFLNPLLSFFFLSLKY